MVAQKPITSMPFKKWLWQDWENRKLLILSAIAIAIQFIWLKTAYPYPNFFPDSYSYLEAAFNNSDINQWPIGYSKFLRLVSCFTHSDTALIFLQYVLIQISILYFLFTIIFLLQPKQWVIYVLFICNILNPLLLYTSNFVSSDALFVSISIIWCTQLLWILHRSTISLLAVHAIVLLLAFTIRYNALYYPVISIVLIISRPFNPLLKATSISLICITIGAFIGYTTHKYYETTGTAQFSAFGGWQLASNALFAYAHISSSQQGVPIEFEQLHAISNKHTDSLIKLKHRPDTILGIYYLWNDEAPLKKYMAYKYKGDTTTDEFKKWASMSPLYSKYGAYLIKEYTGAFIKNYILSNIVNYYVPSTEFLATYNMGDDTVKNIAKLWFQYKTNDVHSSAKGNRIRLSSYFPIIFAIINLTFLLSLIGFLTLSGFKKSSAYFRKALKWILAVWFCNFIFSVAASPIVLRYQISTMVITLTFMILIMSFIIGESQMTPVNKSTKRACARHST